MPNLCYLCGSPASKSLELKSTFTAHSLARVPSSDQMCDRCHKVIVGDWQQCWYWNEAKNKWSKLWSRNWSWLWQDNQLLSPVIKGIKTEGKDTLPIVSNLPTRRDIKKWLTDPPDPPFTIAIAVSGQKHIFPWAQPAQCREIFPVQFETESIIVNRAELVDLLNAYSCLMTLGFSKGEIDSGSYRSDRLANCLKAITSSNQFWQAEETVSSYRGSLLMQLTSFVS